MQNGKVEILANDQGNRITPSYVAFTDEERLVGDAAKNQYAANPQRTVFEVSFPRLLFFLWPAWPVLPDEVT
jgi:heat shock protein 5